jgi:iron uptake system component EfeO
VSPVARRMRTVLATGLAAASTAGLAACGRSAPSSSERPASAANSGDAHTANITITADKCVADRRSYAAGGITFNVRNQDATGVSEFELIDGERIIGEKENLPPGFAGSFSLSLNPGTYEMYCPGATTARVPFMVTGTATSAPVTDTKALLAKGTKDYGAYIEAQIGFLVEATKPLVAAINRADVPGAKAAYAKARPYYERIEPVAESFQDLDPALDARADDGVAAGQLTGFHRIEYALWSKGNVVGLGPIADKMTVDVTRLQKLAHGLTYQPAELANGAVGLLDEVSKSKVTGEEERYSHMDLLDFQANVEGSEQAFANLQPGLVKIDSTLSTTIATSFAMLDSLLEKYRDAKQVSGFVPYPSLSKADITALAQAVQAVAEPLSRVASKVVTA